MLSNVFGTQLVPGVSGTYETFAKSILWGRRELDIFSTGLFSSATVDGGNTPTTLLRPGLILGKITSSGLWKEWSPTAVDGSQFNIGILMQDVNMLSVGAVANRFAGWILEGGCIKASKLIQPGESTYGLSGKTYEHVLRKLLAKNFTLDDAPHVPAFGYREHRLVTADTVVTAADQDVLFIVNGGTGVNFTLPATALAGMRFGFYNGVDQDMTITSGTADKIVTLHELDADSIALSTASEKIGGSFDVFGSAAGLWYVRPYLWEGQTVTVVD